MAGPLDGATRPQNNFDAIRLVAALAVLIGHCWPLTGRSHPPAIAGIPIYDFAVFVFFAVSGFLIATSWARSPSILRFLANRVLRIFPALALVVLVTVFVIGPAFSTLAVADYLSSPVTWGYLVNLVLVGVYRLPGVFDANPLSAVNGVLWSLGPEFLCYLGVLVVGVVLMRARYRVMGFGVATVVIAAVALGVDEPLRTIARCAVFFGVSAVLGTLLARGRSPGGRSPDRRSPDQGLSHHDISARRLPLAPILVLVPLWLLAAAVWPALAVPLAWIVVPYAVIALGSASTPVIRRAGRFGDVSYGVYLWGFLVQQAVVALAGVLPLALNLVIVVPITVGLAALSWHLVEKRALRLKPRPRPLALSLSRQSASTLPRTERAR